MCGKIFLAVNEFYYEGKCIYIGKENLMGQKIKELRIRKGLTQAALSGETVTRNMLSQIENGVAKPSVTTISEIAEKLDVPTEYFFSESTDLGSFQKLYAMPRIRRLFAAGEYAKCLTKLENLGVVDDETALIMAKCAMALGVAEYHAGSLASAEARFSSVIAHASKTIYAEASMREAAEKYLSAIAFVRKGERFLAAPSVSDGQAVVADLAYISMIAEANLSDPTEGIAVGYAAHLHLRRAMLAGACPDAAEKLKQLLESPQGQTDAILRYYVLGDIEAISRENGDYKTAYECSAKRLALAEQMNQ